MTCCGAVPKGISSLIVPRDLVLLPDKPTKVAKDGVRWFVVRPMDLKALKYIIFEVAPVSIRILWTLWLPIRVVIT